MFTIQTIVVQINVPDYLQIMVTLKESNHSGIL